MALNLELNKERFLDLLKKLIGETVNLQNDPDRGYTPKEELACAHVLDAIKPYLIENGGCLHHEHLVYDKKQERGNLIIGYVPETWKPENGTVSFIGSHLDVVPANPDDWNVPPFELTIDANGDSLYGRGTTDCLGHVALVTDLFIQLAEKKPDLKRAVWGFLICSEEHTTPGIGIDRLVSEGKLERCRNGPCYWIDSSERQPCIGCASKVSFVLAATGKTGHSGFPNQAINSIEFGDEACKYLQDKFYIDFPAHPQEEVYGFQTSSSMKPTQLVQTENSINQIPGYAEINGDIRLTPFYDIEACKAKVKEYAEELNRDPTVLPRRGQSGYVITDDTGTIIKGELELKFVGETLKGIACKLDSDGYKNLNAAVTEVVGESVPYSITGSLPTVGDLQEDGFDIQITGFGFDAVFHGDNEYCSLSWMEDGMKIMSRILEMYNEQ